MQVTKMIRSMVTVSASLLSACGAPRSAATILSDDDNVITLEITQERRPAVETLLRRLVEARDHRGALKLNDLIAIVPIEPHGEDRFLAAYPDPFTVTCDLELCRSVGAGGAARALTVSANPNLADVEIGVRTTVAANFLVSADAREASVCAVDGVYFARSVFRKNLKAFRVRLGAASTEAELGTIKVWLAGASDVPTCATP